MFGVINIVQQMSFAWALDKVIDLNNGLNINSPLTFKEEVICLAALFSYSFITLLCGMAVNYLISKEDKEENSSRLLLTLFFLFILFLPLNTIIRTQLHTLEYLVPVIYSTFVLDFLRRQLYKYLELPSFFLFTLCTDFISFPLVYFYLGSPDLSQVLLQSSSHAISLLPDMLACCFYIAYILCQSYLKSDLNSQINE